MELKSSDWRSELLSFASGWGPVAGCYEDGVKHAGSLKYQAAERMLACRELLFFMKDVIFGCF
jgi:hypothetical protein